MTAALNGLVLAGGRSRRMGQDKAALLVAGQPALARAVALLKTVCAEVFVSVRPGDDDPLRAAYPTIEDRHGGVGPADGIASGQAAAPDRAWLVVACDLPLLDAVTLKQLLAARDPATAATAFRSANDGLPEPLCAIYEPASRVPLAAALANGLRCARKILIGLEPRLIDLPGANTLDNMNTPDDLQRLTRRERRA